MPSRRRSKGDLTKEEEATGWGRRKSDAPVKQLRGHARCPSVAPVTRSKGNTRKEGVVVRSNVRLGGVEVEALIDTGASVSCLNRKTYRRFRDQWGPLEDLSGGVQGADGRPLRVEGITRPMEVSWGRFQCTGQFVVLGNDDPPEIILGTDLLVPFSTLIDMGQVEAHPRSSSPSRRSPITLGYNATLSPNEARTFQFKNPWPEKPVIFSPDDLPLDIVAPETVSQGPHVSVRVCNLRSTPFRLQAGWTLGQAEEVDVIPPTTKPPAVTPIPQAPKDLTKDQQRRLQQVIDEYADLFAAPGKPLTRTPLGEHQIKTTGPPIRQPQRRQNPIVRQEEEKQVKEMLEENIIRPSDSPWASPVVMVRKKSGDLRFCVDFRRLNDVTQKDAYSIPRIDDILDALQGAAYYTTLDLKAGYWQVPIEEKDRHKTAFRTSAGKLFEFLVTPFGLTNAPATFARVMEKALADLNWKECLCYLDDIVVVGRDFDEHLQNLRKVLQRLRESNLSLSGEKCEWARRETCYLGHRVSSAGVQPDPRLLEAIREIPPPTKVREVRSFLGLVGYYRRFIKDFSSIAAPLHALTKKTTPFVWDDKCQGAMEVLKGKLLSSPIVGYPDFDKPFRVYTDASYLGLGAVLAQKEGTTEKTICCASRALSKAEKNYSATKLECLAIVWALEKFRNYLLGAQCEIITDHHALQWLRSMRLGKAIEYRWAAVLEEFNFTVSHRPGKAQGHVDGLSRLPWPRQVNNLTLGEKKHPEATAKEKIQGLHRTTHAGVEATFRLAKEKYPGAGTRKLCEEVVRECLGCQVAKDYRPPKVPKGRIEAQRAWETVSVDVVGPLPADQGKRFLVVFVDCFSGYVILVPTADHTAETVTKVLLERVINYFGVPQRMLSDNGPEFISRLWSNLLESLQVKIVHTSPYHPQGNGINERSHRTCHNILRAFLAERKTHGWVDWVAPTMLAMNALPKSQHRLSPSMVALGRDPRLPTDPLETADPLGGRKLGRTAREKLEEARRVVAASQPPPRATPENPYKIGGKVLVALQPHERESKLAPRWAGPYVVLEAHNPFQVTIDTVWGPRRFHLSQVKPFIGEILEEENQNHPAPPWGYLEPLGGPQGPASAPSGTPSEALVIEEGTADPQGGSDDSSLLGTDSLNATGGRESGSGEESLPVEGMPTPVGTTATESPVLEEEEEETISEDSGETVGGSDYAPSSHPSPSSPSICQSEEELLPSSPGGWPEIATPVTGNQVSTHLTQGEAGRPGQCEQTTRSGRISRQPRRFSPNVRIVQMEQNYLACTGGCLLSQRRNISFRGTRALKRAMATWSHGDRTPAKVILWRPRGAQTENISLRQKIMEVFDDAEWEMKELEWVLVGAEKYLRAHECRGRPSRDGGSDVTTLRKGSGEESGENSGKCKKGGDTCAGEVSKVGKREINKEGGMKNGDERKKRRRQRKGKKKRPGQPEKRRRAPRRAFTVIQRGENGGETKRRVWRYIREAEAPQMTQNAAPANDDQRSPLGSNNRPGDRLPQVVHAADSTEIHLYKVEGGEPGQVVGPRYHDLLDPNQPWGQIFKWASSEGGTKEDSPPSECP